jgi:lipopolysaccharide transport system ATP-binding protein
MSSEFSLSLRGVSKDYRIPSGERPSSLREAVGRRARSPLTRQRYETFQALDDISFDVSPGEAVGIIGRNGAGKSTLLKILSRITPPTAGEALVRGRMGCLLEVGTGFHPELTGRENVYLSGTILGMSRKEIKQRFSAIVEFAGVERFLEVPVKRYSSGMYVRLAFAVAAHLEPEVLVIDEVLAVGDADFQARCLGRMNELASGGRTVLFVSHSMPAITRLCTRAIYLENGKLVVDGRPGEVIGRYMSSGGHGSMERSWARPEDAPGDDTVRLKSVSIRSSGSGPDEVSIAKDLDVEVTWWVLDPSAAVTPALHFRNEENVLLFVTLGDPTPANGTDAEGRPTARGVCTVPGNLLTEGRIFLSAHLGTLAPAKDHVFEPDAVSCLVVDDAGSSGARRGFVKDLPGVVRPLLPWHS